MAKVALPGTLRTASPPPALNVTPATSPLNRARHCRRRAASERCRRGVRCGPPAQEVVGHIVRRACGLAARPRRVMSGKSSVCGPGDSRIRRSSSLRVWHPRAGTSVPFLASPDRTALADGTDEIGQIVEAVLPINGARTKRHARRASAAHPRARPDAHWIPPRLVQAQRAIAEPSSSWRRLAPPPTGGVEGGRPDPNASQVQAVDNPFGRTSG